MQIVIQNFGVNEFDVPSVKAQLLLLLETANYYGLESIMQLSEMIALFQKLDTINPIQDGRPKRPPCQFFSCNFYKRTS